MEPNVKWPAEQILESVREVRTVLVGVPGTEAKGLCGDVEEIKQHLLQQNGKVAEHDREIARLKVIALIGFGTLGAGGIGAGITLKVIGG